MAHHQTAHEVYREGPPGSTIRCQAVNGCGNWIDTREIVRLQKITEHYDEMGQYWPTTSVRYVCQHDAPAYQRRGYSTVDET